MEEADDNQERSHNARLRHTYWPKVLILTIGRHRPLTIPPSSILAIRLRPRPARPILGFERKP